MRTNTYLQGVPKPPETYDILLNNFSGGLNNRSEIIQDHESPYVLNMRYDDSLGFVKREGTELYDNVELNGAIIHVDEFKPYNAPDELIRATIQALYVGDKHIKSLSGEISGANNTGRYFFADGDSLYVYGEVPTEDTTYTKVLGTVRTGYQLFKVVSPPSDFIPLDEEHTQGVTNWDYSTNTVWYEPCTWEMRDTYKGANVVPDSIQYVVSHNGRLYLSGAKEDEDNVFISDLSNPFYYPVYLPIQLPPNSDKIRGLAVFDNAVIVGREFDMYAILGDTNRMDTMAQTYYLHKLNTHTGFANNKRSKEHTSELHSRPHLVCRLLLEKKKTKMHTSVHSIKSVPLRPRFRPLATAILPQDPRGGRPHDRAHTCPDVLSLRGVFDARAPL